MRTVTARHLRENVMIPGRRSPGSSEGMVAVKGRVGALLLSQGSSTEQPLEEWRVVDSNDWLVVKLYIVEGL